jgi:hypothetical protein
MKTMSEQKALMVRVLFIREGESFVAQCLEFDIAAQGKTITEVKRAFERTLIGQMMLDVRRGKRPFEDFGPAPRYYWEKYEQANPVGDREPLSLPKEVPPAFIVGEILKEMRVV